MHLSRMFDLDVVARIYEGLTSQRMWRHEIGSLLTLAELDHVRPMRCLDLGCGPGESSFVLADTLAPESEVVGIDISHAMIARARSLAGRRPSNRTLRFEQADATHLPFASGSFDVAIGHSFLYLVRDPPAVLRETHRLLAPGGHLLLMEPRAEGSLFRAAWASRRQWSRALTAPVTTLRFAASMVLWRLVSGTAGRLSKPGLERWLTTAGLQPTCIESAMGGLGLRCVGRRSPVPGATERSPSRRRE